MNTAPGNGVSTREHIEEIIGRVESSFKQQIGALRDDIKHMQSNSVTRTEHQTQSEFVRRELDRLDREQREGFRYLEEETGANLKEFKDDLRSNQNRMMAMIGVGIGLFEFVMRLIAN